MKFLEYVQIFLAARNSSRKVGIQCETVFGVSRIPHHHLIFQTSRFLHKKDIIIQKKENVKITLTFHQDESTSLIMYIFRMDTATNLLIKSAIRLLNCKERLPRRSLAVVDLSRFSYFITFFPVSSLLIYDFCSSTSRVTILISLLNLK